MTQTCGCEQPQVVEKKVDSNVEQEMWEKLASTFRTAELQKELAAPSESCFHVSNCCFQIYSSVHPQAFGLGDGGVNNSRSSKLVHSRRS